MFTQARQFDDAIQHALAELLNVPGDSDAHRVLHNVACVYGGLSALDEKNRVTLEDMAIEILGQTLNKARQANAVASELNLIQTEDAQFFGPVLIARPVFLALPNANTPANLE